MYFDRTALNEKYEISKEQLQACTLTLEEFFSGNSYRESFAVNVPYMTIEKFRDGLMKIQERNDVSSVLISVVDLDSDVWAYSDTVYVIGDISRNELEKLSKKIKADNIEEGLAHGHPYGYEQWDPVLKTYTIFWD